MAILKDENHALKRRVHELEAELHHLQNAHARLVSENAQLKEHVNTLAIRLRPEGIVEEERTFSRVSTSVRVDSLNGRGNAAMGIARDMSLGGAFIETDLSLFPGEIITVVFEFDAQPFKISAEVIRVINNGYGIKFLLAPQQREVLEIYIMRFE